MLIGPDGGSAVALPPPTPPPAPPKPPPSQTASPALPSDMVCQAGPQATSLAGAKLDPNGNLQFTDGTIFSASQSALKGLATANPTRWFPQGPLPPSASVVDGNGYTYTSDMFGRPVTSSGNLSLNPNASAPRTTAMRDAQTAAGGPDRLATDEGGHGIGNQFFGRGDEWNLTPQDGNLNHSAYRAMENSWRSTLQEPGGTVTAQTRAVYDEPTLRPTDYVSEYSLNGDAPKLRVMENAPNAGFTDTLADVGKNEATLNSLGRISQGLDTLGKVAVPVAVVGDGLSIYAGYRQDGGKIGIHTMEATGSAAGGWAGAAGGAEVGADAGAAVGVWFGGVGAVPGAVIGGLVGGAVGGFVGSQAGKDAVKYGADAINGLSHTAGKVVDFGKSAVQSGEHLASKALGWMGL